MTFSEPVLRLSVTLLIRRPKHLRSEIHHLNIQIFNSYITEKGDRGSTVVKVLCYKTEGRWFDSLGWRTEQATVIEVWCCSGFRSCSRQGLQP